MIYRRGAEFDSGSMRGLDGAGRASKILYAVRREFQHPLVLNDLKILHAVRGECLPDEEAEGRSSKAGA